MYSSKQKIERIKALHENPENIRNMCVIAHVDHGKTTISDCLLASNNIISKKSAGKLRYLDSRPDEQERFITMKSSSDKEYLINMIDSPGHIEFSSEVSSALRLCDGALVVVDAAEGVGCQTYTVLRQAYDERVKTVLVINKIDRLINEIKLTAEEAYKHISIIIEQVNAILSSFIGQDINSLEHFDKEKLDKFKQTHSEKENLDLLLEEAKLEEIESKVYFVPEKNNVIFASAWEGWAFTLGDFSKMIAKRLKVNPQILIKYLWGEYYLNMKTRKLYNKPWDDRCKPLAVQFMFETIWKVYETAENKDAEKMKAMVKILELQIADKLWDTLQTDPELFSSQLMNIWLPFDRITMNTIVAQLPNPREAQKFRLEKICPILYNIQNNPSKDPQEQELLLKLQKSVIECNNSENAPLVMYISKMVSVPNEYLNDTLSDTVVPSDQKSRFIGFARIFSGRIQRGADVHIIYPKSINYKSHDIQGKASSEIAHAKVSSLFLLMALHVEGIAGSSAGNIIGVGGIDTVVFKIATLSNISCCPTFSPIQFKSMALLKVTISTPNIDDNQKLIEGLKKLNKADPAVEVYTQETGEIVLSTCGEVHLQRCIRDLQDTFAKVEVRTSEPIVSFRETITSLELSEAKKGGDEKVTWNKNVVDKLERREKKERKKKTKYSDVEVDADEIVENTGELDLTEEIEEYRKRLQLREWNAKTTGVRNKGKLLKTGKFNALEIKKKNPYFEATTGNQRFAVKMRAVSLNFDVAEWLEKHTHVVERIFCYENKINEQFQKQFRDFDEQFHQQLTDAKVDKQIISLIDNHLYCFGPKRCGPNLLIFKQLPSEESLIQRFRKLCGIEVKIEDAPPKEEEEEKKKEPSEKNIETKVIKDWEASMFNPKNSALLKDVFKFSLEEFLKSVATGFDLSSRAGPLFEEPMMGVIFILEDLKLMELVRKEKEGEDEPLTSKADKPDKDSITSPEAILKNTKLETKELKKDGELQDEANQTTQPSEEVMSEIVTEKPIDNTPEKVPEKNAEEEHKTNRWDPHQIRMNLEYKGDTYGPISGQMIGATKEACLESFMGAGPRIVEGMLLCYIQSNLESFGKVFDVLSRRRAIVIENEMHDTNNIMIIKAHLPVYESFGFYKEMLDKTSGTVNPQLEFDTWRIFDEDPFYIPQTEEELEEFGDTGKVNNFARQLFDKIRRRKGLQTEEKLVVAAEKQRNLSKTK